MVRQYGSVRGDRSTARRLILAGVAFAMLFGASCATSSGQSTESSDEEQGASIESWRNSTVRVFGMGLPECNRKGNCRLSMSFGSGIAFAKDDDLFVATNAHVVADQRVVSVQFPDDDRNFPAIPVAVHQGREVAILEIKLSDDVSSSDIESMPVERLHSSPITTNGCQETETDACPLTAGESRVLTLGYPFNPTQPLSQSSSTFTRAMELRPSDEDDFSFWGLAIKPAADSGNSGGPAINEEGEFLGLVFAKRGSESYVVPGHSVSSLIDEADSQVMADQSPDTDHPEAYDMLATMTGFYLRSRFCAKRGDSECAKQNLLKVTESISGKLVKRVDDYAALDFFLSWIYNLVFKISKKKKYYKKSCGAFARGWKIGSEKDLDVSKGTNLYIKKKIRACKALLKRMKQQGTE